MYINSWSLIPYLYLSLGETRAPGGGGGGGGGLFGSRTRRVENITTATAAASNNQRGGGGGVLPNLGLLARVDWSSRYKRWK